jgi:3-mercaptopyruvate sulfurtransferase SseA
MAFADPAHELTPTQLKEALASDDVELIDVREPYEWDAGRIPGARHIELERLAARAEELPTDRTIVFQCRLGVRSAMAMQAHQGCRYRPAHRSFPRPRPDHPPQGAHPRLRAHPDQTNRHRRHGRDRQGRR